MNEKLQYAEMLNIPVNTSTVTYKQKKKPLFKRFKNDDKVKEELIAKVNSEESVINGQTENKTDDLATLIANDKVMPETDESDLNVVEDEPVAKLPESYEPTVSIKRGKKHKNSYFKANVVGIQLVVIGVLAAIICLTSALVPNSGINVFFREVFGKSSAAVSDTRNYEDFSANIPVAAASVSLNEGVMIISEKASVYPPCDGVVSSIEKDAETGKFTMVIKHNENFKSVFSGVDYAYAEEGGSVFKNIPVGYVKESATLCFMGANDSLITGYGINGNSVVWAV
ncbi:MAG: hypothetical protein SPL13_06050 [Clostridia bacterium]|nr:hypothetical protein [Clostridia bacterium]